MLTKALKTQKAHRLSKIAPKLHIPEHVDAGLLGLGNFNVGIEDWA